jgi:endonuclease/exonuclease/phosphatase family metal-dependent hydrolase
VIVIDFWKLADGLSTVGASKRHLAISFGASAVFMAALIFAQIFTTTYDYVPIIGPLFRDRFWIVVSLPAFVLAGTLLALPRPDQSTWRPGIPLIAGLVALLLIAPPVLMVVSADPEDGADGTPLTIVTYNVQQGYDADNRRNFDGQLDLLRSFDADIIGLQESDTGRVAGGNDDLVRYFADNLDLYSYYGPKTVTGTFGVALLSRYPIEEARTYYLFSEGEQKAIISARVTVGGKPLQVFIVHLGNGGPLIQQEQLLSLVPAQANVIMAGDFNFRPNTPQYRLTVEQLDDAWLEQPSAGFLPDPDRDRIDYVFVSSSIDVLEAVYLDSPESNHPAFVVKIAR